jgi:glycosyltransferase involved in cell wall biosynthesis
VICENREPAGDVGVSKTTDAPVLSVIIPTYNRAAMVRDCVLSMQRCGLDGLQVVVVDDGSKDDTEQQVRALGDNVLYLRQQNQGPAAARNLGFQHSGGRYVAFVDDDDKWLPGTPAKVVELLDRHREVDAVFADASIAWIDKPPSSWLEFVANGSLERIPHQELEPRFRVFEGVPFFRHMVVRNPVFISAVVLRREAIAKAGMFDLELRGAADWELWLRVASQFRYGCWPEPLAVYYRHDGCMSNDNDHMLKEFMTALKKCREKCPHLGADEQGLLRTQFRNALFGYAYWAYDRGDYASARVRFGQLLREAGFESRAALLWFACALPFGMAGKARRLKQVLTRSSSPANASR